MVRLSKQTRDRSESRRKRRPACAKTGPLKDHLAKGFREHVNALEGDLGRVSFVGKVKSLNSLGSKNR